MTTFDLTLSDISKIEGKCSLTVKVVDGKIDDLKFAVTEYKRFYSQALRNKDIMGLPQLSCRICGTCSNAHLLCAIQAVEDAMDIVPTEQTKTLRELLNYGLLIRDHALHLYVFVLPDMIGVDNILELDEEKDDERQILEDTFGVKAAGNALSIAIGGRSVHAPYPTVGGFSKIPNQQEFPELVKKLQNIRPAVLRLIQRFVECTFTLEREVDFAALVDDQLTFMKGQIVDSFGMCIPQNEFGEHLEHDVIPYSHASGYKYRGKTHMVGAISRLNLAKDKLHPNTQKDVPEALAKFPTKNIFQNNLAQAIEILHSIDRSIDILNNLTIQQEQPIPVVRKAGIGVGVIEAPRGTLFYRLQIDSTGKTTGVQVVVPTGQNQIEMEQSLHKFISNNLDKDKEYLTRESEKIIRAHDPCMSCASHFLELKLIKE
ncbi:Ni/Fe hydrogenase subunit alpha [Patescibacteria group bacterium]